MGILIADIPKNSREVVRFEVSEFKGRELINIRIWYQDMGPGGDMVYKPTQKGVTLNLESFEDLKQAVLKLGDYITDQKNNQQPEQPGEPIVEDAIPEEDEEEEDTSKER